MDKMLDKRAIELSINFIVILIISIIIFGFGVTFISRLSKQATDLQELTIGELDEKIGSLVCEGSERVCVGIDRKTIKKTDFGVFGVKIINILESEDDFTIEVKASDPIGYAKDKSRITSPPGPRLIVNPETMSVNIGKNEERTIGIGVQVPPNAISGTYILNIEIKTETGNPYSAVQKLYVDVP